jgi:hypothetical protein
MNMVMWRGISTGMECFVVKNIHPIPEIYGGIEIR